MLCLKGQLRKCGSRVAKYSEFSRKDRYLDFFVQSAIVSNSISLENHHADQRKYIQGGNVGPGLVCSLFLGPLLSTTATLVKEGI